MAKILWSGLTAFEGCDSVVPLRAPFSLLLKISFLFLHQIFSLGYMAFFFLSELPSLFWWSSSTSHVLRKETMKIILRSTCLEKKMIFYHNICLIVDWIYNFILETFPSGLWRCCFLFSPFCLCHCWVTCGHFDSWSFSSDLYLLPLWSF